MRRIAVLISVATLLISSAAFAASDGVSGHVNRTLHRAFLASDIVRAILDGSQPIHLTLDFIKKHSPLPIDWDAQRQLLGFVKA